METPKISIPSDEIYKVCLLGSDSKFKRIYVFNGNKDTNLKLSDLFSETELLDIETENPEIIFSDQIIHKDDTIEAIKIKLIHELGSEISYNEIYLFMTIYEKIKLMNVYLQNTKNEQIPFDKNMFGQLIMNLNISNTVIDTVITPKESYHYADLVKLDIHKTKQPIKVSLGQKFTRDLNLMFSANPFDILHNEDYRFENNFENLLVSLEYSLLLNYGNPINNMIYMCLAEDIFDYAIDNGFSEENLAKLYFPLLANMSILTKQQLIENHSEILGINDNLKMKQRLKSNEIIDLFYKIYYSKTNELPYMNKGIQSFRIVIHPHIKTNFPLEAIFKNIHVSQKMPYIKYNPGLRHENIYRLYSEQISKTGKKIPYLSKSIIMNLSKQTGKSKQISFYIKEADNEFIIDFEHNGNIRVKCELQSIVSVDEVNTMLKTLITPIVDNINDLLEQNGYVIRQFEDIYDSNIEIEDMKYVYNIPMNNDNKLKLTHHKGCITSIFNTTGEDNISKGAIFIYKRVENFQEMDAMSMMIRDVYDKTESEREVIVQLIDNFKLSEEDAYTQMARFLSQYTRIHGKFVNKEVDIAETPGFITNFHYQPFENKLRVEISNISSFAYIQPLDIYMDTILRLSLDPKSITVDAKYIKSTCSTTVEKIEPQLNTVIIPKEIKVKPIQFAKQPVPDIVEEDEDDDEAIIFDDDEEVENDVGDNIIENPTETEMVEEDDEGILFDDEEETEEDESKGGNKYKGGLGEELDGKIFNKSDLLFNKMLKKDKKLFTIEEKDGYTSYPRICPSNANLQPVILTEEEKAKIDKENPGSYTQAIKYGSDPNNQHYYICPRYWCLATNTSITEEDVKAGKCGKVLPPDSEGKPIPPGHYVYEFTDKKYHIDSHTGKYRDHYPGFKKSKTHPDNLCLPCCYNNWDAPSRVKRRNECLNPETYVADTNEIQNTSYIIGVERFPLPKDRYGFLPPSLEIFFNIDHNDVISKQNSALIKADSSILLRYGVEYSKNKSFIGCVADIYAEHKSIIDKKPVEVPTIKDMIGIIANSITLDMFLKYNNGSLPSIFKMKQSTKLNIDEIEKYKDTEFYKTINQSNESQVDFLEETILSFQQFLNYLNDEHALVDYTYLWDFISNNNTKLFDGGINLIIMNILNNDITDNMEIICPSNSYNSKLYDPRKYNVFILKRNDIYEPIYLYDTKDNAKTVLKLFHQANKQKSVVMKNVKRILNVIQNTIGNQCYPRFSMPNVYKFKHNMLAFKIYGILKVFNYVVESQVMNYQGKIIGLITRRNDSDTPFFVPCFPSAVIEDMKIVFMDDDIWSDYQNTRDELKALYEQTKNHSEPIYCKPMLKVIEDNLIVGILTETNQFLQIVPPQENIQDDGIDTLESSNYLLADKVLTRTKEPDIERVDTTKKILLESQFYLAFRTTIRGLMNQNDNSEIRAKILDIIDHSTEYYKDKLKKIEYFLRKMSAKSFRFTDINQEIIDDVYEISTCKTKCEKKSYCLVEDDENCRLILPKNHLISNVDNETVYFGRMADELLRYKRVKLFMFEPKYYLNVTNNEYKIRNNEVIMLQSLLTNEYFDGLIQFPQSDYVKNITFEQAVPSISTKKYDNLVSLDKQDFEKKNIDQLVDELGIQCIKETVDVVGNVTTSYWKKFFPKNCREIIFHNSARCSFYVLLLILQKTTNEFLSIEQLKITLWNAYNEYMPNYQTQIVDILFKQGKQLFMANVRKKTVSFESILMSEEYFLTNLDIWMIAHKYNLPILLFSSKPFKHMNAGINWLLLSNVETIMSKKIYCIRCPSENEANAIPVYHLITPSLNVSELNGFEEMLKTSVSGGEYKRNIISLPDFLEQL